jgi:hypothetical protein
MSPFVRRVVVVDSVTHVQDKLGDTVGAPGIFEVYSMDVGTIGQTLLFHVATNYVDIGPAGHGTDGDFLLRVGKGTPLTFGLAVDDRTTDDPTKNVTAGDLYTGAVFNKGEIVPKYFSQINGYTAEVVGESYSAKLVGEGGDPWLRDIYGGVQLSALGTRAADGLLASWTMWCGNDEVEIKWPPKPPLTVTNGQVGLLVYAKPVITALIAPGDKNPDVHILGPYTHGASHVVTIAAKVTAVAADPVVAVIFVLADGQRIVDTDPKGGWTASVDVGNLAFNGALLVTAVTQSGVSSSVFNGQIQIV